MSYSLTKSQFLDGSKTETMRLGWADLKVGDHFMAVEKAMGLKKGEKVSRLGECVVVAVNRVPVISTTYENVVAEGFPSWTPTEFIDFFCKKNGCKPHTVITRIKFRRAA